MRGIWILSSIWVLFLSPLHAAEKSFIQDDYYASSNESVISQEELQKHQKALDEARARLRHELQSAKSSEKQTQALNDLKHEQEVLESMRRQVARSNYADRGRSEMLANGDTSVDAKIVSEWAKGLSIEGSDPDPKMQEEIRKRFPATSAAQAMQGWTSGQDLQKKREEARKVLRERQEQKKIAESEK